MWLLIVTSVASIVVVSRATTWQQTPETVCPFEGMSAHLPWRYTLEAGEAFNLVRWYQGKPVGLQIATYQFSSNTFTPNAPYDSPGKLTFDNTTRDRYVSITINNVTLADDSRYSVTLQPVGDNTNGFLRVQKGDIQCCALRDNMGEICGRRLDLAGGYNYTLKWNYTEAMEVTDQEMDITVYYDGSSIVSCTGVSDCTIQSFEVPKGIDVMELNASLSLRVNSSTCHTSHETYVINKLNPCYSEPGNESSNCESAQLRSAVTDGEIAAFCMGAILIVGGIIIVAVVVTRPDKNSVTIVIKFMLAIGVLLVTVGDIIIIYFVFEVPAVSLVVAVVVTVLVCLLLIGVVVAVVVWWRLKGRHVCSANKVAET